MRYIIYISVVLIVGLIVGLSGALYNDSINDELLESNEMQEMQDVESTAGYEEAEYEEDPSEYEDANPYEVSEYSNLFLGCWKGPYANNKRTVVICITNSEDNKLKGNSYLILPSGETVFETKFNGKIEKLSNENKIKLILTQYGKEPLGVFEIVFDKSIPNEGSGTWKSNNGDKVRAVTIQRAEDVYSDDYDSPEGSYFDGYSTYENSNDVSNDNCNDALIEYENFVDEYIDFAERASEGDYSVITKAASLMQKAERAGKKIQNMGDVSLGSSCWDRYLRIQQKLANAALRIAKNIPQNM